MTDEMLVENPERGNELTGRLFFSPAVNFSGIGLSFAFSSVVSDDFVELVL